MVTQSDIVIGKLLLVAGVVVFRDARPIAIAEEKVDAIGDTTASETATADWQVWLFKLFGAGAAGLGGTSLLVGRFA